MNVATDPTQVIEAPVGPPPIPTGPQMVPVDFTRLDPLPPPPRKENVALIHFGTAVATLGSVVLVLSLFLVPWFSVRDIAIVQPPAQGQGQGQSSTQTTFNSFAPRVVMRDLHDFGVVAWASSRREKRDVAIVALALLTQASVVVGSVSYRWRLFLSLGGAGAFAVLLLALLDYRGLNMLIRERVATATNSFSGSTANLARFLKITDARPGLGMIVLLMGAGCILLGVLIAFMGGRRGKVIAPVAP